MEDINFTPRQKLEDSAYYTLAEAYSKGYARSLLQGFDTMTNEELHALISSACTVIDQNIQEEQDAIAHNLAKFRKHVDVCIDHGASDYATALRWMTQTETFRDSQCIEHWVWQQGILFSDKGKEIMSDLKVAYNVH